MEQYNVVLLSAAYADLDEIYEYIAHNLQETETALGIITSLEEAIFSLEELPFRGSKRRTGAYANSIYRQLIVKNFTIIYRIAKDENKVVVVAVRYAKSLF